MRASRLIGLLAILLGAASIALAIPDRPAPGDSASTSIIVLVPSTHVAFPGRRLEVTLHEIDPRVKNREVVIDKYSVKGFHHNQGADTVRSITLGVNQQIKPGMRYVVRAATYDNNGQRTTIGELEGKRGPCEVLSIGKPRQVTLTLRRAELRDIALDIADELKAGNDLLAKDIAKARVKDFEELYEIMNLYRPRNKRGMGWGLTPSMPVNQDGLENRLRTLARAVPLNFVNDHVNNDEAALWIAAVTELTVARGWEFQEVGQKRKADFAKKAAAIRQDANLFLGAMATRDPQAIQASAKSLQNACDQCHNIYRD